MEAFPTFDDFRQHARTILLPIERRRKRYLTYFVFSCALALTIASITIPGHIRGFIEIFSITFIFFFLVLMPLSAYRKRIKRFGPHRLEYSLKHDLYSNLLAAFGPFKFVSSGSIPLPSLGKAVILPPFDRVLAEDYIIGEMNDMTVRLTEISLVQLHAGSKVSYFHGMLILLDTSESRVKLRRDFIGHTVLTPIGSLPERIRAAFPASAPQAVAHTHCYSTDTEECGRVFNPRIAQTLTDFHEIIGQLRRQREHVDTKIFDSLNNLYDYIKEGMVLSLARRPLTVERLYEQRYGSTEGGWTRAEKLAEDDAAIHQGVYAECFDDKVLIAIPYPADLFEPHSLFEPPLSEEDIRIIYALMDMLNRLTKTVSEALAA